MKSIYAAIERGDATLIDRDWNAIGFELWQLRDGRYVSVDPVRELVLSVDVTLAEAEESLLLVEGFEHVLDTGGEES